MTLKPEENLFTYDTEKLCRYQAVRMAGTRVSNNVTMRCNNLQNRMYGFLLCPLLLAFDPSCSPSSTSCADRVSGRFHPWGGRDGLRQLQVFVILRPTLADESRMRWPHSVLG